MAVNLGSADAYLMLNITDFVTNFKSAYTAMKDFDNEALNTSDKVNQVGNTLVKVGAGITAGLTVPLVAAGKSMIDSAITYESAFTGVMKTTDEAVDSMGNVIVSYDDLSDSIREMSQTMSQSAAEIAGVAEVAGQLGIKAEDLMQFTEVMIKLGDTTNVSSEEAATALARFVNITGMAMDDVERLGSVVVDLGNNMATTEKEIIDMATNISAAGSQAGISEANIFALAGTLSSLGLEAAAGGTAISRLLIDMNIAAQTGSSGLGELQTNIEAVGWTLEEFESGMAEGGKAVEVFAADLGISTKELKAQYKEAQNAQLTLNDYARVAGMTGDEFKQAFQEDAAGALVAFMDGLGNASAYGTTMIEILQDMDISEVRLRDAMMRTGSASDLLAESIDLSNEAWEENTALTEEAELRYGTTESKIQILKNKVTDMAISFGTLLLPILNKVIDFLGNLINSFNSMDDSTRETILLVAALAAGIGPLITAIGGVVKAVGAMMAHPVVAGITLAIAAIAALVVAIQSIPSEMSIISGQMDEATAATAAWREEMESLDTSIPDMSNMVNEAGESFNDLQSIIDEKQGSITEIYSTAFNERRRVNDEEIIQINKYIDEIAAAQDRMYKLYEAQLKAQISMLEQELKAEDLTYAERVQLMGKLENAQLQYADSISESITRELTMLEQRKINGEISEKEYLTQRESILEKQKELVAEQEGLTQQLIDTNLDAMSQQAQINAQDYAIKETHVQSMEDMAQVYADKIKLINDDITLSESEKNAALAQLGMDYVTDSRDWLLGVEQVYYDYSNLLDAEKVKSAATFFDWIGQQKSQGKTLSDENEQTAKDIVNAYASLPVELQDSGKNALLGLAEGMADEFPELKNAADMDMNQLVAAMNKALGNASPSTKMKTAGVNLLQGLMNGLSSLRNTVINYFTNIGRDMISSFESLFGIQSPAKVTEDIGEDIEAGLLKGLKTGAKKVAKEVKSENAKIIESYEDMAKKSSKAIEDTTRKTAEQIKAIKEAEKQLEKLTAEPTKKKEITAIGKNTVDPQTVEQMKEDWQREIAAVYEDMMERLSLQTVIINSSTPLSPLQLSDELRKQREQLALGV